jgi:hypothetical protein
MLLMYGQCYQCYPVIRMQLGRPERYHPGPRQLRNRQDRLKILGNNKNIQSIISVNNKNILLRRFRLKFLRIMYSTSCYKERLNFENTLYNNNN